MQQFHGFSRLQASIYFLLSLVKYHKLKRNKLKYCGSSNYLLEAQIGTSFDTLQL